MSNIIDFAAHREHVERMSRTQVIFVSVWYHTERARLDQYIEKAEQLRRRSRFKHSRIICQLNGESTKEIRCGIVDGFYTHICAIGDVYTAQVGLLLEAIYDSGISIDNYADPEFELYRQIQKRFKNPGTAA